MYAARDGEGTKTSSDFEDSAAGGASSRLCTPRPKATPMTPMKPYP
jgi:hypothetical protein